MLGSPPDLMSMLKGRRPSPSSLRAALSDARADLGLRKEEATSPVCVAYALLKGGAGPDEVSRLLSWREFEQISASILRVSGYSVRENMLLTKPRAQLDLVATGPSLVLSIDCKHYQRGNPRSALAKFARDQLRRSGLLRKKEADSRPIASVILSTSEPEGHFVEGVAVVPVRTLRSFLVNIESYGALLDLR